MNDAGLVRLVDGTQHLAGETKRLGTRHPLRSRDTRSQGLAGQELHGDERLVTVRPW